MVEVTLDAVSEQRLSEVCPLLASKIRQMAGVLTMDPTPVLFRVTQGLRTWEQQAELYAQGRTAPGEIVTDAPPGYGWHEFGMAVDNVPMINMTPDWNETHPVWQRMMAVGDELGLTHVNIGTRMGQHRDWPHFQFTGRFWLVPDDEVRQLFRDGGTSAVWKAAFD